MGKNNMPILEAQYIVGQIERYKNNPFIEALPLILEPQSFINILSGKVEFSQSDKNASASLRSHMLVGLMNNFFQPITRHVHLENKISILLREGYVGRNINDDNLIKKLQEGYQAIQNGEMASFSFKERESTASSLAFIGCSGSGKTTTINRILATYPQCIYHPKHNFTQIVYLKIDCPHDGSLKSLCMHFFRAIDKVLDTNYEKKYGQKRYSIETLMPLMGQLANHHAIGMLIIDEIQHLSIGKSGGAEKMLNFFVTLVNTVNLPVVMIGTPKARFIFEGDFRSARRGAGLGSIFWEQMKEDSNVVASDGRVIKSEWNAFTDKLWKYQWLKKADITLSDEIRSKWYEFSQGILDIVVKLFVLAQFRAIDSDLVIPDIDKKILHFQEKMNQKIEEIDDEAIYQGHVPSLHLHRLLQSAGFDSKLLPKVVFQIFEDNPDLDNQRAMMLAMNVLMSDSPLEKQHDNSSSKSQTTEKSKSSNKTKTIRQKDWQTLPSNDLRFLFSEKSDNENFYDYLKAHTNIIFDFNKFLMAG